MNSRHEPRAAPGAGRAPQNAPFRASIPRDSDFKNTRPQLSLAVGKKMCPNGRILLAFSMETLRDYFLSGHIDQQAQAEPDNAPEAKEFRGAPSVTAEGLSLEQSFERYTQADARLNAAVNTMQRVFTDEILRLAEKKDFWKSCALLKSMPSCALRYEAGSKMYEIATRHGESNIRLILQSESPEPYNWDRAAALRDWGNSVNELQRACDDMLGLLKPLIEDCERRFDREGLMDLIARTPDSIPRTIMMDKLEYDMAPSQHALFPEGPSP
ncbi:hypothetical protein AA14337_2895 [Acetobacter malorum DSM 14337]|uniref:Uncharacterized protein n=2 Tax=Acetobacter malorum TaxID=178901 RepID=A0ABQ0PYD8_9PROT|nr:hypothetical protein AD930_06795 [Acetobacter malorum]GBQ84714.1 hypothetical protein AA14337_2895 [Acetobacter malorum DSM 14337]